MPPSPLTATVRVTGVRRGRFVEFDYSVGDRDLSVELIMPFAAFAAFCRQEGAAVLPPAPGADLPEKLAGLYRPPAAAAADDPADSQEA